MSRKVFKINELEVMSRCGYRYIASIERNYYATTYYIVRSIDDLWKCGGIIKDCPSVIMMDKGIDWSETVLARDVKVLVNHWNDFEHTLHKQG